MHKKVQSLLIMGVLSANVVGSTVVVFADDTSKITNNTEVEKKSESTEEDITWQKTTEENYKELWDYSEEGNVIVLNKYKKNGQNQNVEIPRKIGDKKVELNDLDERMFPNVTRIKVAEGTEPIKLRKDRLESAFANNPNLKSLDLRGIDVSDVKSLFGFLQGAINLEYVNLSGWDVSNVTNMGSIFSYLESLETLDISGWKTSDRLTYTSRMFYNCSKLTSIDLSGFNMDNVDMADSMFEYCSSLTKIKGTENWTLKNVKSIQQMFKGTKLNFIDLSKSQLPNNLNSDNIKGMFEDSGNLLVVTNDEVLKKYEYNKDGRTPFNITFNANGGKFKDGLETKKIIDKFTITPDEAKIIDTPTREGYTFDGWEKVNNNTSNLNAKWHQIVLDGTANDNMMVEPPVLDGTANDNMMVEPPVLDGTANDNMMVEPPVLDGTANDNMMVVPEEHLPSIYKIIDRSVVDITQRGNGKETNPVILEVKDVNKANLNSFLNKLDSLNSNVSTIKRGTTYTEYNMTVDNKNLIDSTTDKITNVILKVKNTKTDLVKASSRYSRKRNHDVKIPIIVTFNDLKDTLWAKTAIEEFASMGVVDGYANNEFKPNNSITRAEFVRLINNAFGYNELSNSVKFTDVSKDSWYYNDISIAVKKGYINGRSATTFAPDDNITREEAAMMLTNIMNNKDNNLDKLSKFSDGNKTSDWAKSSVEGAIEAGYFVGDGQNNLKPNKNMTRAEAISALSRVKNIK